MLPQKKDVYKRQTVSDKRAKKGDTVTITTAPDDGYALDTVTVKDEKGKEIKLTDLGNGKFSFTMPDSKITIDAQFVEKTDEIPVVINPFADVKESDWFLSLIHIYPHLYRQQRNRFFMQRY